jgi:hypothetical protein
MVANMARSVPVEPDAEADFDCRLAELDRLKSAIIADITMAHPVRLTASSLGDPDWPAMQLIVALARLSAALHLPFELVDAPDDLLTRMDDAGINWRSLNLKLIDEGTGTAPARRALPIF